MSEEVDPRTNSGMLGAFVPIEEMPMKISLTPELERRIAEKVESGLYGTASEVVREGLRLLFALDETREQLAQRLRADIQLGLEALDRGEAISSDEVFAEADKRIEARRSLL